MNVPVLAALAIPIAYLVLTTILLLRHPGSCRRFSGA